MTDGDRELTATLELVGCALAFDGGANLVRCTVRLTVMGFGDVPVRAEAAFLLPDRELAEAAAAAGRPVWDEHDVVACLEQRTGFAVAVPAVLAIPLPGEPGRPRPLVLRILDRVKLTPAKYGGTPWRAP